MVIECNKQSTRLNKAIEVEFVTTQFFSDDPTIRKELWNDLDTKGGLLIIDSISMYHPQLNQYLLRSQLMRNQERLAMVVISPFEPLLQDINLLY